MTIGQLADDAETTRITKKKNVTKANYMMKMLTKWKCDREKAQTLEE